MAIIRFGAKLSIDAFGILRAGAVGAGAVRGVAILMVLVWHYVAMQLPAAAPAKTVHTERRRRSIAQSPPRRSGPMPNRRSKLRLVTCATSATSTPLISASLAATSAT